MTITDFTPNPVRTNPDNPVPGNPENPAEPPVHVDPESWYSLIGKPLLTELIGALQARGHQKLFINEAGEIFFDGNNSAEIKDTVQHFTPSDYWAAVMDIFTLDER